MADHDMTLRDLQKIKYELSWLIT